MDQELIAYFDERFRETSQQIETLHAEIGTLREESARNFERTEDGIRQTQVMVEGLRSDVRLIAEGVVGGDEKLEAFKAEVTREFKETRSLIGLLPYPTLESRVRQLEVWRETKERDPLDIIRERLGNKTL